MKYILLLAFILSVPVSFQAANLLSEGSVALHPVAIDLDPVPLHSEKQAARSRLSKMKAEIKRQHGFFNRVALLRKVEKTFRQKRLLNEEISPADKKAKQSLWIGIIALVFAMIPWYTLLAAIPLGIIALNMGSQAKRMGSANMNGKGFGIAALALVALWFLLIALVVAAFTLSWGGIFA
jgi:hypothetical protein